MEKESLYIKYLDADGNERSFPDGLRPVKIGTFEYNAQRMGGAPTIDAEFYHETCLDELWTRKEYVTFNGEKFYVSQVPSSSKSNADGRYKHEVTFTSARAVLENIYAYDVVTSSTETQYKDRYRSNTTSFSFYGTIEEFVARINDSLVYSGVLTITEDSDGNKVYDGYHIVVDDGVETDSLEVSFEDLKISEALQEIYNVYELTYYWDGETCHVGEALHTLDTVLEYGKGKGLLSVDKTNDNNALVDRVTGYGGSTNIQYYYPNSSAAGSAIFDVYDGDVKRDSTSGVEVNLTAVIKYCPSYEGVTWTYCTNGITSSTYVDVIADGTYPFYDDTFTEISVTDSAHGCVYATLPTVTTSTTQTVSSVYAIRLSGRSGGMLDLSDFVTKIYYSGTTREAESTVYIVESTGTSVPDYDSDDELSGSTYFMSTGKAVYIIVECSFTGKALNTTGSGITVRFYPDSGLLFYPDVSAQAECFLYGDDDEEISYSSSGITLGGSGSYASLVQTWSYSGGTWSCTKEGASSAVKIVITGREWMSVSSKLMPSVYRETLGEDRFYPAVNYPTTDEDGNDTSDDRYVIPDTEEYYEFENEYEAGNPHEAITEDEDIYPTIKNVYNADGELIAEILEFAYDEEDSDALTDDSDEDDPEYIHSYFYAKLRVFDGDYGFNLFEQAMASEEAYITLTGGNCSSCTFQIAVEKELADDGLSYIFYNPVLTDDEGNLLKQTKNEPGDDGYLGDYILGLDQIDDPDEDYTARQQDTQNYEVWVALKKDNETFGVVMPNATSGYYPSDGDPFVLTGIALPQVYIDAAETKLDEYLIQYMWENNTESFSYSVTFSRNWIARNEDIASQINENSLITVRYNGIEHQLFISSYSCKADDNILYEITVELTDELTLSSGTLRTEVEGLKSSTVTASSSSSSSSSTTATSLSSGVLAQLKKLFLSKTDNDTASGAITFLKGILFGEDGLFSIDENGNTTLNDAALSGALTVENGVTTSGDVTSGDFDEDKQSGFGITKSAATGKWSAFFTNLTIWGKAIFNELEIRKLSAVGGSVVLSAASSKIFQVEEYYVDGVMTGWKCWYLADDGTTATQNGWQVGDQARCQSFNIDEGTYENVGNKDYWRCVILVSSENEKIYDDDGNELYDGQEFGWIVLSLTNAQASDYGSTYSGASWDEDYAYLSTPAAGDAIVLEGHQVQDDDSSDELNRMNLIILTAAEDDPQILMYQGIYTFSLEGRMVAKMAPSGWEILSSSFTWNTGSVTVPNYVDMGEWTDGCTAGQYTIWYYNGETWRFDGYTDEDGNVVTSTTEAPSEGASGWVRLTYTSTSEISRAIFIELSLGGQMYYDETETVTLSVWDVMKTTEYTSDYTFSVERDSGDDSSDAVWNAAFAANYDGGTTFTISFSDLNFVDGSRTTKFWVYATENDTDEELEEALIEY